MCGIAGIVSMKGSKILQQDLQKMADTLLHRGPDGEGFWINCNQQCGFGHRRLAILDLTDAARQPMHYLSRYTIVFNGEIYNYRELKNELMKQGYQFRSSGDTEVILAAYDCYKEKCVDYFDGMFSFSIWDEKLQVLFCARDRFGEKPFYYTQYKGDFYFASEMKALWASGIPKNIDQKILLNYLSLGYVQNAAEKSQTFYTDIFSLSPAHHLIIDFNKNTFQVHQYWDIDKQACIKINEKDAVEQLDHYLGDSIIKRLRSDVPVGVSLSGGLDSSTICSYLHKRSSIKELHSFSATFPDFEKDESVFIKEVGNTFNIHMHEVTPTCYGLIEEFEKIAYHQEEPFPSSSIYAQYKVFELARQNNIPVLLDGQGADETLAGYHKYLHWYLQEVLSRNRFSKFKKERFALLKNNIKVPWNVKNLAATYLPSHAAIALEKQEYLRVLRNDDLSKNMLSNIKGREWDGIHKPIITKLNDILYFNTMCNGMEELLRFSDRNAMAHGIEVRLPFLNADLVKFIFSLPSDLKISNGFTKYILRKLMQHDLPEKIVWRTDKVGFEPPQKLWMQEKNMQEYIYEAKSKLVDEQILKASVLKKKSRALPAHSRDNFDWRYLCAANMLR